MDKKSKINTVDSVAILFVMIFILAWKFFLLPISLVAVVFGMWHYFLITKKEKLSFIGYAYKHPIFFLVGMLSLGLVFGWFDNVVALFYIGCFYVVVTIGSYLVNKIIEGVFSWRIVFAKIVTILSSLWLWYAMISQIYFAEPGNHFVGMFLSLFIVVVLGPYVIIITRLNLSKCDKSCEGLLLLSLFGLGAYIIKGFIVPATGAFMIFSFPYFGYVLVFSRKKKVRLFAGILLIGYMASLPYFVLNGTDFGRKIKDPCFVRDWGKGSGFFVKDNRVCGYTRDGLATYAVTVDGLDVKTFQELGSWYAKDTEGVYYSNKLISNRPKEFKELDKGYYTDGKRIFYRGEELDVDLKSFWVYKGGLGDRNGDAQDKNHVYRQGMVVKDVAN
jgi:hypothetical protein